MTSTYRSAGILRCSQVIVGSSNVSSSTTRLDQLLSTNFAIRWLEILVISCCTFISSHKILASTYSEILDSVCFENLASSCVVMNPVICVLNAIMSSIYCLRFGACPCDWKIPVSYPMPTTCTWWYGLLSEVLNISCFLEGTNVPWEVFSFKSKSSQKPRLRHQMYNARLDINVLASMMSR